MFEEKKLDQQQISNFSNTDEENIYTFKLVVVVSQPKQISAV